MALPQGSRDLKRHRRLCRFGCMLRCTGPHISTITSNAHMRLVRNCMREWACTWDGLPLQSLLRRGAKGSRLGPSGTTRGLGNAAGRPPTSPPSSAQRKGFVRTCTGDRQCLMLFYAGYANRPVDTVAQEKARLHMAAPACQKQQLEQRADMTQCIS